MIKYAPGLHAIERDIGSVIIGHSHQPFAVDLFSRNAHRMPARWDHHRALKAMICFLEKDTQGVIVVVAGDNVGQPVAIQIRHLEAAWRMPAREGLAQSLVLENLKAACGLRAGLPDQGGRTKIGHNDLGPAVPVQIRHSNAARIGSRIHDLGACNTVGPRTRRQQHRQRQKGCVLHNFSPKG
jgi:hypothetical protein